MEKQSSPNNHKEMQARVDAYVDTQAQLDLLRFITCGSVDDGKSTLIGRMLYEAQMIFEDQITSLQSDSKKVGTQGADIDFALLVDGLVGLSNKLLLQLGYETMRRPSEICQFKFEDLRHLGNLRHALQN